VELRHLNINDSCYYYLVEKGKRIYLGKEKPTKDELEDLIKLKPQITDKNIIELLQDVQKGKNFISEEDLIRLSQNLDIPLIKLTGVASFYKSFKTEKQGKYKIKLCNGTACNIKHSPELLRYIETKLNIKSGETSKDGLFSLEVVNCIGACARAPAIMINEDIYGNLTKDKVEKLIEDLK